MVFVNGALAPLYLTQILAEVAVGLGQHSKAAGLFPAPLSAIASTGISRVRHRTLPLRKAYFYNFRFFFYSVGLLFILLIPCLAFIIFIFFIDIVE